MSDAFAPPKPKELESAVSILSSVGSRTIGNWHAGSMLFSAISGGSHWPRNAMRQTTASTAPAAPSRWPMLAFVELTGSVFTRARWPSG